MPEILTQALSQLGECLAKQEETGGEEESLMKGQRQTNPEREI